MQMRRKNPSGFIASICRLAPSRSPSGRRSGGAARPIGRGRCGRHRYLSARQQIQMSEREEDQGQSKGGRPRKDPDERRSLTHGLRLSPNEKEKLEQRAKRAGLNLSEYIRRRALGKKIQTKVEEEAIRQIRRAGVNLNQIAKWANQGRNEAVHSAAESTIQEVKQAIRQLL